MSKESKGSSDFHKPVTKNQLLSSMELSQYHQPKHVQQYESNKLYNTNKTNPYEKSRLISGFHGETELKNKRPTFQQLTVISQQKKKNDHQSSQKIKSKQKKQKVLKQDQTSKQEYIKLYNNGSGQYSRLQDKDTYSKKRYEKSCLEECCNCRCNDAGAACIFECLCQIICNALSKA